MPSFFSSGTTSSTGSANSGAPMSGDFGSGANRAIGREFVYTDGMSEDEFMRRNAFGKESGYGLTNFLNPVGGILNAFRGRSAYKKARARYERAKEERWKAERAHEYGSQLKGLDVEEHAQDVMRQEALDAIGGHPDGGDPIAQDTEREYQAKLQNALAGLGYEHGQARQRQGLRAAQRGTVGGSNDAEQVADQDANLASRTMDVTQSALGARSDALRARRTKQSMLRRALLSGDAGQAARYMEGARGHGMAADREARAADFLNAFAQIRAAGYDDTSRAWGQVLGGLGTSYRIDQDAKANGGQGLYSWTG